MGKASGPGSDHAGRLIFPNRSARSSLTASNLAALLAARAEDVAEVLLGTRNSALSSRIQLRFGSRGSKVVDLIGEKRGLWCDFESGEGGDMLDLAAVHLGGMASAITWARQWLGVALAPVIEVPRRMPRIDGGERRERDRLRSCRMQSAIEIFRAAIPVAGTAGEVYLRWRGVTDPIPPTFRFAHALSHPAGGVHPALICGVQGADRRITAVQRIWLANDGLGKADVAGPKRTLGPLGEGALRLASVTNHLGIAEGPETGLSAQQMFGVPTWVSCGAGRMKAVRPPEGVFRITIFADNGAAGEREAFRAAELFQRQAYKVDIRFPSPDVGDFNDELRRPA